MDIGAFLMQFGIYIGAFVVIGFFIFKMFVNVSGKTKILRRDDVEKKGIIKSMKYDYSDIFKTLWHGRKYLGKIISYKECWIENPNEEFCFIVFAPKFFWKLSNPFKKEVLQIFKNNLIKEYDIKKLTIPNDIWLDEFMGTYHDMTKPEIHLNIIKENMFKNDMKSLASIYYVEAQKQATINLEQAKAMELLEKQLQIEQAKRERVISGG